jgi:hypothetical protein
MRRIRFKHLWVALVPALLLSHGCKKKKKTADKMLASPEAKSELYKKTLTKLQAVAADCKAKKSLGRWTSGCKAYEAFYNDHKKLFDGYKAHKKKVKAILLAGVKLMKSSDAAEQSVGATVIARGLYSMAWARARGRKKYRKVLAEAFASASDAKVRAYVIGILSNDGGTAEYHGGGSIAKVITKAAGGDSDAQVRNAALDAIKYKLWKKYPPSEKQLRAWFAKEKPSTSNQLAIISIAERLKLKQVVVDLCKTYETKHGSKVSTCTDARKAVGATE